MCWLCGFLYDVIVALFLSSSVFLNNFIRSLGFVFFSVFFSLSLLLCLANDCYFLRVLRHVVFLVFAVPCWLSFFLWFILCFGLLIIIFAFIGPVVSYSMFLAFLIVFFDDFRMLFSLRLLMRFVPCFFGRCGIFLFVCSVSLSCLSLMCILYPCMVLCFLHMFFCLCWIFFCEFQNVVFVYILT